MYQAFSKRKEIDELRRGRINYPKHAAEWETVDKKFRAMFPGFQPD